MMKPLSRTSISATSLRETDARNALLPVLLKIAFFKLVRLNLVSFAANFSSEMGILTNETLLSYQNFQLSGLAIKKESFVNYGMLKPTFKLTFGYEFLLRMTHNSGVISIPSFFFRSINKIPRAL